MGSSADPRICVSLPVHEQPAVIFDQVENLRSFFGPDTLVVLHLSRSLGVDPADLAPLLPDGVHVNPRSHATEWGDIAHLHFDNLRYAYDELDPFDHVLLNASNDLYVRRGAPERIASAQWASHRNALTPDYPWAQAAPAHRDAMLAAILADLGDDATIFGSQVEGTFFAADLFREMLERIERRFRRGEGEHYAREEIYFPTLAAHLCPETPADPLIYVADFCNGPAVSPAVIFGLADGTFAHGAGTHYGVKRVARRLHDPNRQLIRAVSRGGGPRRLTLNPGFPAKGFIVLAFAADILNEPSLIRTWHATFDAGDDATLAVFLSEREARMLPTLIDLLQDGGTAAPGAADIALITAMPDSFEQAALRWAAHALLRPADAPTPALFDDLPIFGPANAGELVHLAARRRELVVAPA
jgi:hypothetical protein